MSQRDQSTRMESSGARVGVGEAAASAAIVDDAHLAGGGGGVCVIGARGEIGGARAME